MQPKSLAVLALAAVLAAGGASAKPRPQFSEAPRATVQEIRQAEDTLVDVIERAQGGMVDYSEMEPDLVKLVKPQQAGVMRQLKRYGAIVDIEYVGQAPRVPIVMHHFVVTHERGKANWFISFSGRGLIDNLVFKPA